MAPPNLTPSQYHALLDILSHQEVYAEIRDLRTPGCLTSFGPPFSNNNSGQPSSLPVLQALLSKFVLDAPGICNVPSEYWRSHLASLLAGLDEADLSESYDKGHFGLRKTLATAFSALIEYPARGVFAGFDEPAPENKNRRYDLSSAKELQQAFTDVMHESVYGNLIDEVFEKAAVTANLADHKPIVQAAHEFILVNLASFLHFALIISPKGQHLLSMLDHANRLVPYAIIRQTLKIGNVASMINAMMKVVLAKVSMASLTNWAGVTNEADEGMNLMQQIISGVLHWDKKDLKSKSSKVEKDKDGPSKAQLEALKEYLLKSREEHERLRDISRSELRSIVSVILEDASVSTDLTQAQHTMAQDYLAIQLSIRDRDQIVKVLCHSTPDHLTQATREVVAAYEPTIRYVHKAVELSDTVGDIESFLKDLIRLSTMPVVEIENEKSSSTHHHHFPHRRHKKEIPKHVAPTVGDYVQLLKKHQSSLHKFLHECAKNGKQVASWYHEYALLAVAHFRRKTPHTAEHHEDLDEGAGALYPDLQDLVSKLPQSTIQRILPILDAQSRYIAKLHSASATRLQDVLSSPVSNHPALLPSKDRASRNNSVTNSRANSRATSPAPISPTTPTIITASSVDGVLDKKAPSNPGPGAYLARWQSLLDHTSISPAVAEGGALRAGSHGSVLRATRVGTGNLALETTLSGSSVATGRSNSLTISTTNMSVISSENRAVIASSPLATSSMSKSDFSRYGPIYEDDSDDDDVFQDALEKIDVLGLEDHELSQADKPNVSPVIDALLPGFREILGRRACDW